MSKVKRVEKGNKQLELELTGNKVKNGTDAASSARKNVKKEKEPATELMKKVATKTMNEKNMKRVFSPEEIEEIIARRSAGDKLSLPEHQAIREKYRKMKRRVKELEKGNQSRLFLIPSITSGGGFYKMFDFSALYYVYRLADRMGRNAKLMRDTDKFSKMLYAASLVDIDKFKEQFKRFEGPKIEETEDEVIIFTLKQALSDDEVGELRLIEETRRERLHNLIKPKAMDPAVFQAILMVVRQVGPRARKLEKHEYYAIGEGMMKDLDLLLAVYFDFTNGIISGNEVGKEILKIIDRLLAGLAILSEMRIWDFGVAAMIGENINELKRLAIIEFNLKVYKK